MNDLNQTSVSVATPAQQTEPRQRTPRPTRRELWILLAIVALAAVLRAYHLGYKSMWLDELNYARSAFGDGTLFGAFGLSILDHPPAYLFITRLVMFVGRDDWLMRLVPLLSSAAAVVALWGLARTMFGAITGLLAAFVLAITPMHIAYSQEAHSYGVYGLLSILTLWFLYRAAQAEAESPSSVGAGNGPVAGPRGRRWLRTWLPFVLLATLNMYVHYYSFYVAALSVLLFPLFLLDWSQAPVSSLWRDPVRRRSLFRLVGALALIALLYLPQAIIGVRNSLTYATDLDSTFDGTLAQAIQWAARAVTIPWQRDPVSGVAVVLVVVAGLGWLLWRRRHLALSVLLLAILPLPPSIYLAYRTGIAFNARRVIFILPVVVIVIAVGMMAYARLAGWLWARRARRTDQDATASTASSSTEARASSGRAVAVAALVLALIAGVATIKPLVAYYQQPKQDWKGVARILAAQVEPGDVVAAPLRSSRNVIWYYRPVRVLDNPRPALEEICQQGQTTYFVVGLQEPLSNDLQTWLANNFVEVPLKDVRIFYRQCGRLASDWYGAGAGPLFRLAINPDLPFAPTQRAYRAYTQAAAETLAQPGRPATGAVAGPIDESLAGPASSLSEERDFDVAEAAQAEALAAGSDVTGAVELDVDQAAVPETSDLPVQDAASAQETAVALALARLTGNATPAPAGSSRRAEAEALLDAGQAQEALSILQAIVAATPDDRAARMSLARALAAVGQTGAALDAFEGIARQWPSYPWSYVRRGELLEQTGNRRAALAEFRQAVSIAPGDADVRFALAYALARDGQRNAAIEAFEAGLRIDPSRAAAQAALERLRQQP
jgi:tetratricopeptide (TPR) repeat protein/uncharacterized membrane protein